MAKKILQTKGFGNVPIRLAKQISERANFAFHDGTMHRSVTPLTAELLNFWFDESYCEIRSVNFHEGQRQAIINIIYLHEVLKIDNVMDIYERVAPELLTEFNFTGLSQSKYQFAKYAVKMATGTGKTWVWHAILIWQILNALNEDNETQTGRFTKNFFDFFYH